MLTREGPGRRAPPGRARRAVRPRRRRRLRPEPGGRPRPRPRRPGRAATGPGAAIMQRGDRRRAWPRRTSRSARAAACARLLHRRRGPGARRAGRDGGGALVEIVAPATVLATGGLGGLYAVTTNAARACAARAWRWRRWPARAIADPEFVQFHPTAIDLGARSRARWPPRRCAARARELVDADGAPFMAALPPAGRARAARRGRPRHRTPSGAAGRGAFLDARAAIGEALPARVPGGVRRLHGRRPRPAPPADPGRAGGPLPHGRDRRPTRDGRDLAGGPLRRRRVRLDRRARRQPAGLQLAAGSGGVRRPRRRAPPRAAADPGTAPLPRRARARPAGRGAADRCAAR